MFAPSKLTHTAKCLKSMGCILAGLFVILALGCQPKDLNLVIRWDTINGLQSGDRVLLDANAVGTVTDVFYTTQGDYRVSISIQHAFANAATTEAQFYIAADPGQAGHKAINIIRNDKGGVLLQDGSLVEGAQSPSWSLETFKDDLNRIWDQVKRELKQLTEDLQRLPEEDRFQKLREALQRLYRDLEQSGQEAQERFKSEILPLLREEVERLREYLRQLGREQEIEPLETVVRDIEAL